MGFPLQLVRLVIPRPAKQKRKHIEGGPAVLMHREGLPVSEAVLAPGRYRSFPFPLCRYSQPRGLEML